MISLVFLHGFLGSPGEWQPLLNTLEVDAPRLALPLPVADCWDDGIQRLVNQLPDHSLLVGYSLGGRVALGAALISPERVLGLCLISPNPGIDDDDRVARAHQDAATARRMLEGSWPRFLDDWYRQELFSSLDEATRTTWVQQRLMLDRRYQAKLLSCYSISNQPDYRQKLSLLATATIVVGEYDRKYVAIGQAMQRQAPDIALQIVPSAGHAVHREQPAALAKILKAFLASFQHEGHQP
jgi:2-succinyl-6-hydroxy-2,4-cyclohexadiene-1-carboxylate synthase